MCLRALKIIKTIKRRQHWRGLAYKKGRGSTQGSGKGGHPDRSALRAYPKRPGCWDMAEGATNTIETDSSEKASSESSGCPRLPQCQHCLVYNRLKLFAESQGAQQSCFWKWVSFKGARRHPEIAEMRWSYFPSSPGSAKQLCPYCFPLRQGQVRWSSHRQHSFLSLGVDEEEKWQGSHAGSDGARQCRNCWQTIKLAGSEKFWHL